MLQHWHGARLSIFISRTQPQDCFSCNTYKGQLILVTVLHKDCRISDSGIKGVE